MIKMCLLALLSVKLYPQKLFSVKPDYQTIITTIFVTCI